nr:hypothetical protein [Streptomyces sp. TRM49041]
MPGPAAPTAPAAPAANAGPAAPGRHSGHCGRGADAASDVVRWAVFSCALVPFVLLLYGMPFGGAATTTLGLAAVTAACRVLLRRSERTPVALLSEPPAEEPAAPPAPHRGRHSRSGTGAHRGGRHGAGCTPGD